MNTNTVPQELRNKKQWVLWKSQKQDNQKNFNYVPYQTNNKVANLIEPNHWSKYTDILFYATVSKCDGIGYVITDNENLVGIKIENAYKNGVLNPKAKEIVDKFNTYAEIDINKEDLNILCKGKLPQNYINNGSITLYSHHAFFPFSGECLISNAVEIKDCQSAIDEIYQKYLSEGAKALILKEISEKTEKKGIEKVPETPPQDLEFIFNNDSKPKKIFSSSNTKVIETEFKIYPYIPKGALTMLTGDPGVGKTWIALRIIKAITLGEVAQDEMFAPYQIKSGKCVYLSGDDDIQRTLQNRAKKIGVKLENFFYYEYKVGMVLNDSEFLEEIRMFKPDLIVIDPIQAFVGDGDMNRANFVRQVLSDFKDVVEKLNISALIIAHHGKAQQKTIHKTLGSIDFIGIARSLLTVERIKIGEEEKIIIGHTKANLSKRGDTIIGHISDNGFVFDEFTSKTIDEILYPEKREREKGAPALDEAVDFLLEFLADGPKMKSEIIKEMYDRGIDVNDRTLQRAGNSIGVHFERAKTYPPQTIWSLPQEEEIEEVEEPP